MATSVQARAGPSSGAMYDVKCPSEDDHAAALTVAHLETSGKLQLHRLLQSISGIVKGEAVWRLPLAFLSSRNWTSESHL